MSDEPLYRACKLPYVSLCYRGVRSQYTCSIDTQILDVLPSGIGSGDGGT